MPFVDLCLALSVAVLDRGVPSLPAAATAPPRRRQPKRRPRRQPFPVTVTAANGRVTIPSARRASSRSRRPRPRRCSRSAPAPRWSPSTTSRTIPQGAPKTKLSGYPPNAEAIARYRPDLVVVGVRPEGLVAALRKLEIPRARPGAATTSGGRLRADAPARPGDRHAPAASDGRAHEAQIAAHRVAVPKGPRRRRRSTTSSTPDYYSVTSKTFVGRVYALFGLQEHRGRRRQGGRGYPQLSAEYIVAANPDLDRARGHEVLRADPAKVAARPGWSDRGGRNGRVVRDQRRHRVALGTADRRLRPRRAGDRARRLGVAVVSATRGQPRRLAEAVRARGVSRARRRGRRLPRGALVVGVLVGPWTSLPARRRSRARRACRARRTSPLDATEETIVWELRVPRVVLGALVGAMLALAGAPTRACSATRSPTRTCSASRPARASARRSRSPTGPRGLGRQQPAARRGVRRRDRGVAVAYALALGRRGSATRRPRARRGHGRAFSPRSRRSCSSRTPTRCRRSTAGCSGSSRRRAGATSGSSRRTSSSRRS